MTHAKRTPCRRKREKNSRQREAEVWSEVNIDLKVSNASLGTLNAFKLNWLLNFN